MILALVLLLRALPAVALAAPPPVFLAEADARALLAHRADPVIAGALTALTADADAAAEHGPSAPLPYAGCDIRTYLSRLTYEYGGAASRAAQLADFAYLHALDGGFGSPRSASAATDQVRAILLGWARDGFRKPDASYRTAIAHFCDAKHPEFSPGSRAVADGLGLQLGRGVAPYVHAFDLMNRAGALTPGERADIAAFLRRLGGTIRDAQAVRARDQNFDCNRYSNHNSVALSAMVAIARATGDERWRIGLMTADPKAAAIGWPQQVDRAVYANAGPHLACYRKPPGDELWQPETVAAGEIADRYRQVPGQTFGYITFSLTNMIEPAVIARVAGLPPVAESRRRLALALDYYAYFLAAAGPDGAIVDAQLAAVPGGEAYLGKVVSKPGCATPRGSDHLLSPYEAMLAAGIEAPAARAMVARLLRDRRCAAFSRLDPVLIGALAHLPAH